MKDFVNGVLLELKNDSKLNENTLIKLVIESTTKSIISNESYDNIYVQLKESLNGVNEHLNNNKIKNMLSQFSKKDRTVDSVLYEMSKVGDLTSKLGLIRESNAYSNPIIKSQVDTFASQISNGTSEFQLYPSFINEFSKHVHESSVKTVVDQINSILENKASDFEVLNTIQLMENVKSPIYDDIANSLKKSLAENKYSSDIINLRHGESQLPLVANLVNNLKITESKKDSGFTLGGGNVDTRITNLIAPSQKLKNGILTYADNRFIKISESTKLSGNESEVHINEGFTIATMDPDFVASKFPKLFQLAESFASLGFKQAANREGVESNAIRNFKIGLNTNESNGLDIYLNDVKIDGLDSINLTEALAMETPAVRTRVEYVFENIDKIFAFEFIKNISNDRLISEATVFELNGDYIICDKPNTAQRTWGKVDEHQMFDFFNDKFQYDISSVFATKIDESIEKKRKMEAAKSAILENVAKLEGSIAKLDETIGSGSVDASDIASLEKLKTSIEESVSTLKEEYITIDLAKGEIAPTVNEKKKMNDGLKAYLAKKGAKAGSNPKDKKVVADKAEKDAIGTTSTQKTVEDKESGKLDEGVTAESNLASQYLRS
jgi:hypothetical protein